MLPLLFAISTVSARRLHAACGGACLKPIVSAGAQAAPPVFVQAEFSSALMTYANPNTNYAVAYGICAALGCNYRNVVVSLSGGDLRAKTTLVYNVTFYNTSLAGALKSALPCTAAVGVCLGVASGGGLATLVALSLLPSPPPPPSSPPPLAGWFIVDSGEVIALDIAYDDFLANLDPFSLHVQAALQQSLQVTDPIRVISIEPSSSGTTLVYFDILLSTTTDYAVVASFFGVQDLFCPEAPAPVDVGTPACPQLLQALQARIPSITGAYYNDQMVPSTYVPRYLKETATTRERFTLSIPFYTYAPNQEFFAAAITTALPCPSLVVDFQATIDNDTTVILDVVGDDCVRGLFPCAPGDGCGASNAFAAALHMQGIDAVITY